MILAAVLAIAKRTYAEWSQDNGWIFAGAMTAFAALASAPIILVAVRIAGAMGHEPQIVSLLAHPLGLVIGHGGAQAVGRAVKSSNAHQTGDLSIAAAVLAAILAASRFTYSMLKAMQAMWSSESTGKQSIWTTIRDVLVSGTVSALGIAFLLTLLFAGSAVFSMAQPSGHEAHFSAWSVRAAVVLGGAAILVPIFAALFKWLPRSNVAWSDVWVGATATAVVFSIGQVVIGSYLALRHVESIYGSVSAVVVLLLWLYYSTYTFLVGAEFTQVYARMHGSLVAKVT